MITPRCAGIRQSRISDLLASLRCHIFRTDTLALFRIAGSDTFLINKRRFLQEERQIAAVMTAANKKENDP